jgi:hypothetical protein
MKKNQSKNKKSIKHQYNSIHYAPLSEFDENDYNELDRLKREYPGISRKEIFKYLTGWKCFKGDL